MGARRSLEAAVVPEGGVENEGPGPLLVVGGEVEVEDPRTKTLRKSVM